MGIWGGYMPSFSTSLGCLCVAGVGLGQIDLAGYISEVNACLSWVA